MKRVTISLIAASAIAGAAAPAAAQDGYVLPPPPPPVSYPEPSYAPAPVAVPASQYPAPPQATYESQYRETGPVRHYGYDEPTYAPPPPAPYPVQHHAAPQYPASYGGLPPVPSVGYTRDEREAWLAQCRQQYFGEGKRTGGLLGGLLGAVGGGVAGHELVDGSSRRRLGGTLIGAGIGGILGAGIGAAIGASADRRKIDECEAYLNQYTGGRGPGPVAPAYGPGYGYGYAYAYPVMMVPVQVQAPYVYTAPTRHETKYVVEEIVEEKVVVPRRSKYVKSAPAPTTKYVKQRYSK